MTESDASKRDPEVTPEDVVVQLRALTRAVQDFLVVQAKATGLRPNDFVALVRANGDDGATGAQLAQAFGMRSGSITELADRLESRGLIARRAHPTDRRTVVLRPTRRGQLAVTRALGPLLMQLTALVSGLDAGERAGISGFLDGISEALATASATEPRRAPSARRTVRDE